MNITWMQGFWIVWGIGFVLLGLVVWQANESGSERTKRLGLEAEIAGHSCPVDTVFIGLGDNRIHFSPINQGFIFPDTTIVIDSSRVTE